METGCIGFLLGALTSIVFVGIGVCFNRMDNREHNDQNSGYIERMDAEEVINGLQTIRMGLSRQEKEYLDYAIECVLKIQKLQRMIDEGRFNNGD